MHLSLAFITLLLDSGTISIELATEVDLDDLDKLLSVIGIILYSATVRKSTCKDRPYSSTSTSAGLETFCTRKLNVIDRAVYYNLVKKEQQMSRVVVCCLNLIF